MQRRIFPWLGALLCSCYVGASGSDEVRDSETEPTPSSSDSSEGSSDSGSDDAEPETPSIEITPRPLQHLTRAQYEATVRDLWSGAPAGTAGRFEFTDPHSGQVQVLGALDPDDTQHGFELGTAMSSFLPEQYFDRAEALAALLVQDLDPLLPCDPAQLDDACVEAFAAQFGLRVYRRPPTDDELDELLSLYADVADAFDVDSGIEAMVFAMLSSPHFLYHLELDANGGEAGDSVRASDYEMASRLSYFLWGSMPDDALLDAAANGELGTEEGVQAQASRLLQSARGGDGLYTFARQWLVLDAIEALQKDPQTQPDFDPALGPELRASLAAQVRTLTDSPTTTVADFLRDPVLHVNDRLAAFYGVDGSFGPDLQPVQLDGRVGVLSHPGVLALTSKKEETQLVARGLFVRERLLCLSTPLPPNDVSLDLPEPDPDDPPANMRERFARHVQSPSCAGCHASIDPIGFAFENYDGLGRYRTEDVYGPVDASGELVGNGDADGPFADFGQFNERLAGSEIVPGCITEKMFEVALGRPLETSEDETDWLRDAAREEGWNLRSIATRITAAESFRSKVVQP